MMMISADMRRFTDPTVGVSRSRAATSALLVTAFGCRIAVATTAALLRAIVAVH